MILSEAVNLLAATGINKSTATIWADLGCGGGLFTKALATRLHKGSTIYSVDKIYQLSVAPVNGVDIIFHQKDFITDNLHLPALNGILMANSLHYVQHKKTFIRQLKIQMLPGSSFIIIEYDIASANRWVPFPVSFKQLHQLFLEEGYTGITKTGERNSRYHAGKMYVALVNA